MVSLINLPAYQAPNALNFSPINDAIDSNRQNALMQQQMGMQKERLGMDRERMGMERQKFDTQQQMATVQRFAGLAQGIDKITDPAQRQAQWQQLLSQHPNAAQLPEIYRDPMQGPRLLMQEAQGFRGPDEEAKLGLTRAQTTLAQAQAEKARREAAMGGEMPANVREWNHFNRLSPEQQQQYLTMKRAERYLNTGDAFVRPNPVAPGGAPSASIPINVAAAAAQKKAGTLQGQAQVDLPKVQQAAATTLKYIDDVLADPNLASVTGAEAYVPTVRSTSRDTEARINQLGGRAFLSAFESLKGGGAITEIEGQKATAALARLTDLKQSDAGFKKALEDFRNEVMSLARVAEQRAQGAGPYVPPAGVPTDAVPRQSTDRLPPGGGWSIRRVD